VRHYNCHCQLPVSAVGPQALSGTLSVTRSFQFATLTELEYQHSSSSQLLLAGCRVTPPLLPGQSPGHSPTTGTESLANRDTATGAQCGPHNNSSMTRSQLAWGLLSVVPLGALGPAGGAVLRVCRRTSLKTDPSYLTV
jgi:hypothetical protein